MDTNTGKGLCRHLEGFDPRMFLPPLEQQGLITRDEADIVNVSVTRTERRLQFFSAILPFKTKNSLTQIAKVLFDTGAQVAGDALKEALTHPENFHQSAQAHPAKAEAPSVADVLDQFSASEFGDSIDPNLLIHKPPMKKILSRDEIDVIQGNVMTGSRISAFYAILKAKGSPGLVALADALECNKSAEARAYLGSLSPLIG